MDPRRKGRLLEWRDISSGVTDTPSARYGHSMLLSSQGTSALESYADSMVNDFKIGTLLLFGGAMDGVHFTPSPPPPLRGVGLNILISWKGRQDRYRSDLYTFERQTYSWTQIAVDGLQPSGRHFHSVISRRNRLVYIHACKSQID